MRNFLRRHFGCRIFFSFAPQRPPPPSVSLPEIFFLAPALQGVFTIKFTKGKIMAQESGSLSRLACSITTTSKCAFASAINESAALPGVQNWREQSRIIRFLASICSVLNYNHWRNKLFPNY